MVGGDVVGLVDIFKGDRFVVIDGYWGLLFYACCWFKDDKDLIYLLR